MDVSETGLKESVTLQEFNKQAGKAIIILSGFIIFSVYRIIKREYSFDHLIILSISILGLICIRRLLIIAERKILKGSFKMKRLESLFLEQILIMGLGILSIYIFLTKGAYGAYLLFKDFDFKMLLYRVTIIIVSYQLVMAISKIQTVFKAIQSNK